MPKQKPGRSKQDYGTPKGLIDALEFRLREGITLDIAATKDNAVCNNYYSLEEGHNAFDYDWHSREWSFLNPPFGNITPWVKRAAQQATLGAKIAVLVPASVGAKWWVNYVVPYAYINYLVGRLTFVGETTPYPKDCALLLYTPWGFTGEEYWHWNVEK